jgi:hypothetical protein
MTLVINGFNFDPSAAGNVVTLSSGTVASFSAASMTSLTIVFATQPSLGPLSATVTAFGLSSGTIVVATVRAPPVVTSNSATISSTQTTLVINGFNFDPPAAGNFVTLISGTVGSISAASSTSLTVVFATQPSPGPLSASVTSFGLSSGAAVLVATVAANALVGNIGNNVTQCAISGGSIALCAIPTGVTWNLNRPRGMAVANNVAYITNVRGNTVTQCQISGGSITSCAVPTGVTWNLNYPTGIAVANNVAYITNYIGNTVTQCQITSGSITSCAVPTGVTWNLNGPWGIAVANNVAYIINNSANTVTQCQINGGGSITSCAVPSVGSWNLNGPYDIALANNVAYTNNTKQHDNE